MIFTTEPSRQTKVVFRVDICVIGGSCTGVFAAGRAGANLDYSGKGAVKK